MQSLITCLLVLLSLLSYGQEITSRCGTSHIPSSAIEVTEQFSRLRQTIEIPVVFHILYTTEEENITDDIIFSQVDLINRDYSRVDPLTKGLPKSFNKKVGTPGIHFCLAKTDPFGNISSGITRTLTPVDNIGDQSKVVRGERIIKDSELGGNSAWDTERFLNVWVAARSDGIAGDATFPDDPEETETDGIVLDYRVVGNRPEVESPFNLGRTLTHEIGHYLNVYHLFGTETGCFNDGDFVDDTPTQFGPYFGTCEEAVSSCDSRDMDTNFMNFRNDDCLYYFTKGQVERMIHTLFTLRYQLISSETCSTGKPIPPDPLKVAPIITLADGLEIPLNTLSEETYNLALYDVSGRKMWQTSSNSTHRYMISNNGLRSNIYVLVLDLKDVLYSRRVFIK